MKIVKVNGIGTNFVESDRKVGENGSWDSIHVFEVEPQGRRSATYKLTSTVLLDVGSKDEILGNLDLSGHLSRQLERTLPTKDEASHIANIGSLVEELESKLRNILNEVYFGKTRDIIGDLRTVVTTAQIKEDRQRQGEVAEGLAK